MVKSLVRPPLVFPLWTGRAVQSSRQRFDGRKKEYFVPYCTLTRASLEYIAVGRDVRSIRNRTVGVLAAIFVRRRADTVNLVSFRFFSVESENWR